MTYPDCSSTTQPVLHWRTGGVAVLRFNRPDALNAIDIPMATALLQACRDIAADPEVRVVLMSGEGRAFMAGGDLAALRENPSEVATELIDKMHAAIRVLLALDAPMVAQVHGAVAGAGLGMMLLSDITIAAEGTRFTVAYSKIGACTDCGTSWSLARALGLRQALEWALLGETIDTAQAHRLGIVNRIVPPDRLGDEALAIAQRLGDGPTTAFGHMKRLLRDATRLNMSAQLDAERQAFLDCARSDDLREGIGAFLEKRPPRFTGK